MNPLKSKRIVILATALWCAGYGLSPVLAGKTNLVVNARTLNSSEAGIKSKSGKAPKTAVEIAAAPVPKSTFSIPKKDLTEGRDPFFPNSTHFLGSGPVDPTPVVVNNDLALRGISGSAQRPLAIVNTTTFAAGETADVFCADKRVSVKCLEIDLEKGTVLLQIGTDRRMLRLNPEN